MVGAVFWAHHPLSLATILGVVQNTLIHDAAFAIIFQMNEVLLLATDVHPSAEVRCHFPYAESAGPREVYDGTFLQRR